MAVDTYLTPTNVSIWVEDKKLDDAFRIDWDAKSPKTPLYGWSDKKFRAVANAREIVLGRLVMNYRFPGYLYTALFGRKSIGTHTVSLQESKDSFVTLRHEREKLRNRLRDLQDGDVNKRAQILLQTLQRGNFVEFHRHETLLRTMFSDSTNGSSTGIDSSSIQPPYQIPVERGPFELRVMYGETSANSYTIEKRFSGVHFVGESQVVSASATGGGDISSSGSPIYEIYSFIAREVKEFVRQPEAKLQDLNSVAG